MKWKDEILCIIQIQNINTVCNFSDLIKEYEWIKRRTDLCNTDRKKNKKKKKKPKQTKTPQTSNKAIYEGGLIELSAPPLFIEASVPSQESVWSCICVLGVSLFVSFRELAL